MSHRQIDEDRGEGPSAGGGRPVRTVSGNHHNRQRSDPYPTHLTLRSASASASVGVVMNTHGRPNRERDPVDGALVVEAARPLNRGAACLACRKKRAKCDGIRPACTRCLNASMGRPDGCVYEAPHKSALTTLRDTVDSLTAQARQSQQNEHNLLEFISASAVREREQTAALRELQLQHSMTLQAAQQAMLPMPLPLPIPMPVPMPYGLAPPPQLQLQNQFPPLPMPLPLQIDAPLQQIDQHGLGSVTPRQQPRQIMPPPPPQPQPLHSNVNAPMPMPNVGMEMGPGVGIDLDMGGVGNVGGMGVQDVGQNPGMDMGVGNMGNMGIQDLGMGDGSRIQDLQQNLNRQNQPSHQPHQQYQQHQSQPQQQQQAGPSHLGGFEYHVAEPMQQQQRAAVHVPAPLVLPPPAGLEPLFSLRPAPRVPAPPPPAPETMMGVFQLDASPHRPQQQQGQQRSPQREPQGQREYNVGPGGPIMRPANPRARSTTARVRKPRSKSNASRSVSEAQPQPQDSSSSSSGGGGGNGGGSGGGGSGSGQPYPLGRAVPEHLQQPQFNRAVSDPEQYMALQFEVQQHQEQHYQEQQQQQQNEYQEQQQGYQHQQQQQPLVENPSFDFGELNFTMPGPAPGAGNASSDIIVPGQQPYVPGPLLHTDIQANTTMDSAPDASAAFFPNQQPAPAELPPALSYAHPAPSLSPSSSFMPASTSTDAMNDHSHDPFLNAPALLGIGSPTKSELDANSLNFDASNIMATSSNIEGPGQGSDPGPGEVTPRPRVASLRLRARANTTALSTLHEIMGIVPEPEEPKLHPEVHQLHTSLSAIAERVEKGELNTPERERERALNAERQAMYEENGEKQLRAVQGMHEQAYGVGIEAGPSPEAPQEASEGEPKYGELMDDFGDTLGLRNAPEPGGDGVNVGEGLYPIYPELMPLGDGDDSLDRLVAGVLTGEDLLSLNLDGNFGSGGFEPGDDSLENGQMYVGNQQEQTYFNSTSLVTHEQHGVEEVPRPYNPAWMDGEEPTVEFETKLIKTFLRHRRQFASEFSVYHFMLSMQQPRGSRRRPHPGFLNAIFLLASWFTRSDNLASLEPLFVRKTRDALNLSLAGLDRLLDYVRGSALLGLYHYGRGLMLEGYNEVHSAANIARACGLDAIQSHVFRDPTEPARAAKEAVETFQGSFKNTEFLLPLPGDEQTLGERIHAFWSVWILDASGSATHGLGRAFDDQKVLTPLPLPLTWYANGQATEANMCTLAQFWREEGYTTRIDPPMTHRIKATAVLEAACSLARIRGVAAAGNVSVDNPPPPVDPTTLQGFEERFGHISRTCNTLRQRLPRFIPPSQADAQDGDIAEDWNKAGIDPVMTHAWGLTLCAMMSLHEIKVSYDQVSQFMSLTAAMEMVDLIRKIQNLDFHQLDIMLGMAWVTTSYVLLREVRARLERLEPMDEVRADAELVHFALHKLGKVFPLVGIQANAADKMLHELHL